MKKVAVAKFEDLADRKPAYALVGEVDLVVVRFDDAISVFYGRCLHRGALMADGLVRGDNLICGVHQWDYRLDTGVSEYNNEEVLPKFSCFLEGGEVLVDADEIAAFAREHSEFNFSSSSIEEQAGAQAKRPNFFIVGAPKCGTTALCDYLRDHPRIHISRTKEPHFFAQDLWQYAQQYYKSHDEYLTLFADAPENTLAIGEGSVFYAFSEVAVANIHVFDPAARLIMMVRNPADMVYSLHGQYVFNNFDCENETDFEKAWRLQDSRLEKKAMPARLSAATDRSSELLQYRYIGRYAEQLERILKYFPKEQVKIVLYEDFKSDSKKIYEETLRFLDVPSDERASFPRINASKVRRFKALHYAIKSITSFDPLTRNWRKIKKVANIETLGIRRLAEEVTAVPQARKSLAPDFRREILATFEDDIDKLSGLIGRDLSHWKK